MGETPLVGLLELGETPHVGLLGLGETPHVGLLGLGETPHVGVRMMTLKPLSRCAVLHGQSSSQAVASFSPEGLSLICCFGLSRLLSLAGAAGD